MMMTVLARVALGAMLLAVSVSMACDATEVAGTTAPSEVKPVSTTATGVARFVDPFIGTGDGVSPDPVANGLTGATFPGATVPFGMVQLSPDTPNAAPPGYRYADEAITGFSFTHLNGAGCPAFRDLPVLPFAARPDFTEPAEDRFSHADEKASPGFYEVKLGSGILVDLTATARTGLMRFTFPEGADAHVRLAAGTRGDVATLSLSAFDAQIVGDNLVTGSRAGGFFCAKDSKYKVYYAARFDRPFSGFGTVKVDEVTDGAREVSGIQSGAFLRFATGGSRVVQMKVGFSYVSVEHAIANLDAENPGWDFDAVHARALDDWNARLGKVEVEGGDDTARRALYTALYHSLVQPAVFSDVDGSFVGFDGKVKVDAAHPRYANFSGWDVYRSWIQLLAVLAPKEASDLVRSLVGAGDECGALPRWSLANDDAGMMIGDPASPTIASAWAFGARDFDAPAALAAMKKNATDPTAKCNASEARPCLADYLKRGYCPGVGKELEGAVSITQEYAVADFSVAMLAKAVGDEATRAAFVARAGAWRKVLDTQYPGGPLAQPREKDDVGGVARFLATKPDGTSGFTEGNATQYTFFVPHDPYGLIEALGGDAVALGRLETMFSELNGGVKRPYFYMGNEPQFATPWLFSFMGAAHRTQGIVRRILREVYATTPGGLPGNDDLGATSAWQAWALLGLYPAVPGSGTLVLGSPWFPKTTVTLASGATLTMLASGAAPDAPYVQSARIGSQALTRSYVTWDDIKDGQTLEFVLGTTPNAAWGTTKLDRPPAP
jgi:predicted alpha-1,2-mannosidase